MNALSWHSTKVTAILHWAIKETAFRVKPPIKNTLKNI